MYPRPLQLGPALLVSIPPRFLPVFFFGSFPTALPSSQGCTGAPPPPPLSLCQGRPRTPTASGGYPPLAPPLAPPPGGVPAFTPLYPSPPPEKARARPAGLPLWPPPPWPAPGPGRALGELPPHPLMFSVPYAVSPYAAVSGSSVFPTP